MQLLYLSHLLCGCRSMPQYWSCPSVLSCPSVCPVWTPKSKATRRMFQETKIGVKLPMAGVAGVSVFSSKGRRSGLRLSHVYSKRTELNRTEWTELPVQFSSVLSLCTLL